MRAAARVIVGLSGGLGNQMFQYAAGLVVALRLDAALIVRFRQPPSATPRHYELGCFRVRGRQARLTDEWRFRLGDRRRRVGRIAGKLLGSDRFTSTVITEGRPDLLRSVGLERGVVLIDGYWQSADCFKGFEHDVARDFVFREKAPAILEDVLRLADAPGSVSMHVRRGDYAAGGRATQYHGVLPSTYYREAMTRMSAVETTLSFLVFSDDPPWVRENVDLGCPVHVVDRRPGVPDCEYMRVMQRCHHHIIANSSFSWWAAWLCSREGKRVIAPRAWFRDPEVNRRASGIVPAEWERL